MWVILLRETADSNRGIRAPDPPAALARSGHTAASTLRRRESHVEYKSSAASHLDLWLLPHTFPPKYFRIAPAANPSLPLHPALVTVPYQSNANAYTAPRICLIRAWSAPSNLLAPYISFLLPLPICPQILYLY
jgi:hypothetical protein